jgi:hypothetical protein
LATVWLLSLPVSYIIQDVQLKAAPAVWCPPVLQHSVPCQCRERHQLLCSNWWPPLCSSQFHMEKENCIYT